MNEFKKDFLLRQQDIIPAEKLGIAIDIIGAGALGSTTAIWLARMGCFNLRLWDDDVVSDENMSNQSFSIKHIGMNKAVAVQEQIKEAMGFNVPVRTERFVGQEVLSRVVVVCVDSMKARRAIFDTAREQGATKWLIESRMGAESGQVHVVDIYDSDSCANYEKTLYGDNEASSEPCTAKSTGYCALSIAAIMVKAVKDIIVGSPYAIKETMLDVGKNWTHTYLRDESVRE